MKPLALLCAKTKQRLENSGDGIVVLFFERENHEFYPIYACFKDILLFSVNCCCIVWNYRLLLNRCLLSYLVVVFSVLSNELKQQFYMPGLGLRLSILANHHIMVQATTPHPLMSLHTSFFFFFSCFFFDDLHAISTTAFNHLFGLHKILLLLYLIWPILFFSSITMSKPFLFIFKRKYF